MTIYFDNAATTYPKPEEVYQAQDRYFRSCANPGRGAYQLSLDSAGVIFDTRLKLAGFLGVSDASRLVFTGGCTLSLNLALKGMTWQRGDVVVTSALEHNAVMRPLRQLERDNGIRVVILPYADGSVIDRDRLAQALKRERPKLCALAEASNVTGDLLDLAAVADVCRSQRVPLLVDAAQSAGCVRSRIEELGVSIWCAPGHKGLLGAPGVGLLYVSPQVELTPLVAGGTGSGSEELSMPKCFPDRLESGTLAGPAIAGLSAAVDFLIERGPDNIARHERELAAQFIAWAAERPYIQLYGPGAYAERRTGIVSFSMRGITPDRVADLLNRNFDIAVRAGLHCAAVAHQTLGTVATGLVRVSFGPFNKQSEVGALLSALESIAVSSAKI
jgi:cysteine desulfurase family protein